MGQFGIAKVIYDLGNDYYVRGLEASDVAGPYPTWFSDQEVCRFNSHGKFAKTLEYFQEYVRGLNREDKLVWAVCHNADGHVGNISLQSISFINRSAELAIILGDRRHWGKGVGARAGLRLLEHGFAKLNLHRIYCGTAATNVGMQKLAAALHMKLEGTRRSHLFLEGQWVDVLEYGVLRDEFSSAMR
jgi:ribosomal-protein-alanine N-acetyltransferase